MVELTESLIYNWVERARIEYRDLYIRLYVAYNAWYQKTTGKTNGYEAITALQTRFVLWDAYIKGESLAELHSILRKLIHAQDDRGYEGVRLADEYDWKALIRFWYDIRCKLIHGEEYTESQNVYVQLAYESLFVFMTEIVQRMKRVFIDSDTHRLHELRLLVKIPSENQSQYLKESIALHQKYIYSPELWAVDMQRGFS